MQPSPTSPRSRLRRTTSSILGLTVLAGLGVAAAAPADARPVDRTGGPTTKSSTIEMVPVDAADPVLNFNDVVTFSVSTTVTDQPMVRLYCYQNGAEVYWSSAGFFPDYPWPWARDFTLRSDYWTGGAADCTATLYYSAGHNKFPVLATTSFHVEA